MVDCLKNVVIMHGVQEEIAGRRRYRTHKDDVIIGISSKGKEGEEKVRWQIAGQVIVNLRKEGEMTSKKN